ncbi:MAG: cupin domain-containing protein, partial [Burkholderiaceae bacterium]|nr:cupin domain-containing protein [Burkholderiaceae bacterium]
MSLPPIRRVLTGDDATGLSSIIEDGPSPAVRVVPERPGYRVSNLWRTSAAPSSVNEPDQIAQHQGVS